MRVLIMIIILVGCMSSVYAQQDEKKEVLAAMQKLAAAYRDIPHLSFDVAYRYAAEDAPAVYLDSLRGSFKLQGNRYWYNMDNTVSIRTTDYLIMLFKEDNLMYLAKPAGSAAASPVAMVDSVLNNSDNITCHLSDAGAQQTITIEFAGGASAYKKIGYYIDKKTGYLSKMISVVRSEQLYDPSVRSLVQGPPTYAIVEAKYSNYRKEKFDESLFESSRYFRKEGNDYVAVAPYDGYRIFWGSLAGNEE